MLLSRNAVLLFCPLLLGCGSATRSLVAARVDTLPGGAVHITNAGATAWLDTLGWKLVLERTIHPDAGSAGELVHPGNVVVSGEGEVFVVDRKPAVIKHFAADGRFMGTMGREGAGPGEFADYGILYMVRDTLVHQDARQSRLSAFTTDGQFIKTWMSSPITERGLAADDAGRIPVQIPTGTMALNSGHGVARFRLDGSTADTVWYPSAPEPKEWQVKGAHTDMGMLVPFAPDRVTGFDNAGRLIWGDQATYRLIYSRTGRDTMRVVDATAAPVAIRDSLRQAEFDSATSKNTWLQGVAKLTDIPRTYPVWTGFAADGANNLWVLRPGPLGEGDHWDVFDPDGRLLGAVPAPFHHVDETFWIRDHVYVLEDARDGTPAILVYRIDRAVH